VLAVAVLPAFAPAAQAQNLDEVFRKASPTVVEVRSKGRDVNASGVVRFTETGSGVLISDDGRVMTAAHVVNGMDEITVEGIGGEVVRAKLMSANTGADVSLLQLERVSPAMRVARMGSSASMNVGEQVMVIGAPYGLSYSMSVGWISARWAPNTIFRDMPLAEFFQTTATINTGNSGGPMFNMAGEVIGIVSHNISKSGGSEGLGFVVTMKTAKELLLAKKSFWGGLDGQFLTDDLSDLLNVPNNMSGYLVKSVAKGSPGEEAGLRGGNKVVTIDGQPMVLGGDIILTVEGIPVDSAANMMKVRDFLGTLKSGEPFTATVLRKGRVLELKGIVP
jgi:S1-C subfamily serine protease